MLTKRRSIAEDFAMSLPRNKTKIVCTIGPASESREMIQRLMRAGMNVARINFSHGDFASHLKVIANLRAAAQEVKRRVAIMADLPGPKIRIGQLTDEPIEIKQGDPFTLTIDDIVGDIKRVSVSFDRLTSAVKPGDILFLNDGLIQLKAKTVAGNNVHCEILVGGELRSRKGLNFPGIDLGISAFTEFDRKCLTFAAEQGVDAVSQSFVETAADITAVRSAAGALGYHPFIIAKIERAGALKHIDQIFDAADGIMIARGDLGVEIPIEEIAIVQKKLMNQARLKCKPVITATQMLESMTTNRRPTRAEATDVANAILDGTDCVMLSGESAMGKYPVDAVAMLAKIAAATEPHRQAVPLKQMLEVESTGAGLSAKDLIALSVETTVQRTAPAAVFVPTLSGATARSVTRFRLPVWIAAVSPHEKTCQELQFSYGVFPLCESDYPDDWKDYIKQWLGVLGLTGDMVIMTEGPSPKHPKTNDRMEIVDLSR